MASFDFTSVVLDEGTTFIFDSWVCVADGAGSFHRHLVNDMKSEASAACQRNGLNEFIDNLDETLLPDLDLAREIEATVYQKTMRFETFFALEEDLDRLLKIVDDCSDYYTEATSKDHAITTLTSREHSATRRRLLRLCKDARRPTDDYFDYSSRLEN
jgi:hypothetical protein